MVRQGSVRANMSTRNIYQEKVENNQVPEGVYQTLKMVYELRKCHNIKTVFTANLFPLAKDIVATEQMYGEHSMYEDMNGNKIVKFNEIDLKSKSLCLVSANAKFDTVIENVDESGDLSLSEAYVSKSSMISAKKAELMKIEAISTNIQKMINESKLGSSKRVSFSNIEQDSFTQYQNTSNLLGKRINEPRKSIQKQSNIFAYNPSVVEAYGAPKKWMLERKDEKDKWLIPGGFQNVLKKDIHDYAMHPKKPPQEKIEDMFEYPWYLEQEDQRKRMNEVRGGSMNLRNQHDSDLSPQRNQGLASQSSRNESPSKEYLLKVQQEKHHLPKVAVSQNLKSLKSGNGSPMLEPIKLTLKDKKVSFDRKLSPFDKYEPKEVKMPSIDKSKQLLPISNIEKSKDKSVEGPDINVKLNRGRGPAHERFDQIIQNPYPGSSIYRIKLKEYITR